MGRSNGWGRGLMTKRESPVKQQLDDSFFALLREQPFERITIRMITERAGVTRPTFYTHFHDKHEIYEWILQTQVFDIAERLIEDDLGSEALKIVFTYFHRRADLFARLYQITGQNNFEEALSRGMVRLFRLSIRKKDAVAEAGLASVISEDTLARYYANSLVFILRAWLVDPRARTIPG